MTAGCGSSRVVMIDAVEAGTSQIIDHCGTRRSSKTLSRAPLVAEACDCRFVDAAQSGVNGAACRPIGFVKRHIQTSVFLFLTSIRARRRPPSCHSARRLVLIVSVLLEVLSVCLCPQEEEAPVLRTCFKGVQRDGELIQVRDTVLLKSGPRKKSLPYVAKISALWEEPETGRDPRGFCLEHQSDRRT